jgi:hypothetical protein
MNKKETISGQSELSKIFRTSLFVEVHHPEEELIVLY